MTSRRTFLQYLARIGAARLVGRTAALLGQTAQHPEQHGCFWASDSAGDQNTPFGRLVSTSGDPKLDRALIAEVRKIERVFGINPGYQYMDDRGHPNARATNHTFVPGTQGTVLIGLSLVGQEMAPEFGGAAVAGITAHEGAHIFQFWSGYYRRLAGRTARNRELHADYLAGYYFASTGRTERSLIVFHRSLHAKGDFAVTEEDHHGTPDERVNSMRAGYALGTRKVSITSAAEEGANYVLSH